MEERKSTQGWALPHLLSSFLHHKESISLPVISTPSFFWWSRFPCSRYGHHLKAHAVLPAERKPNSFIFTGITLHHTSSHTLQWKERENDRRDLNVCRCFFRNGVVAQDGPALISREIQQPMKSHPLLVAKRIFLIYKNTCKTLFPYLQLTHPM